MQLLLRCSLSCHLSEESVYNFFTVSHQAFMQTDRILLSILFSRINISSSQPLVTWLLLQALNHLRGPVLGCPCLSCSGDPALQMWPHQEKGSPSQKGKNYVLQPAENAFPNAGQMWLSLPQEHFSVMSL